MEINRINLEAYNLLFNLENYLRFHIHKKLIEKSGLNYFDKNKYISKKRTSENDLYEEAMKRYEKEKKLKIPNVEVPLIYYLDFIDLSFIIEKEWSIFKKYFPGEINYTNIKNKLYDISIIRNRIAHNRIIRKVDYNYIEIVYDIFLRNFDEKCIENIVPFKEGEFDKKLDNLYNRLDEICGKINKMKILKENENGIITDLKNIIYFLPNIDDNSMSDINKLITLIDKYYHFDRIRGKGYLIEEWLSKVEFNNKFEKVQNILLKLKKLK